MHPVRIPFRGETGPSKTKSARHFPKRDPVRFFCSYLCSRPGPSKLEGSRPFLTGSRQILTGTSKNDGVRHFLKSLTRVPANPGLTSSRKEAPRGFGWPPLLNLNTVRGKGVCSEGNSDGSKRSVVKLSRCFLALSC